MKVNPFDFGYKEGQVVMIPAEYVLNLIMFSAKVKATQPEVAVLYEYPESVDNKYDENGKLLSSETTWKDYGTEDLKVFFDNSNTPVKIATDVSLMADQVHYAFLKLHEDNINKKIAVPKNEA